MRISGEGRYRYLCFLVVLAQTERKRSLLRFELGSRIPFPKMKKTTVRMPLYSLGLELEFNKNFIAVTFHCHVGDALVRI